LRERARERSGGALRKLRITTFLIQTRFMNPSFAPLRAVRHALDVSVLVVAFQSCTRDCVCSVSPAPPLPASLSARVARSGPPRRASRASLEKGIKRRADEIRRKRVAKRERFRSSERDVRVAVVSVPSLVLIQNRKPRRSH
jgi:hypothetical protein